MRQKKTRCPFCINFPGCSTDSSGFLLGRENASSQIFRKSAYTPKACPYL